MRVLNASFVPRAGACTALRTSPLRPTRTYCLPSLVIVGAMRAGTSALCDLLSKQPRYARNADGREVHYFSDPFASPRKLANAWPASRSGFRGGDELVFEKTAQYLTSPGGLAAMFAVLGPALRVVAVLREPGARLYSEFQHHCAAGARRPAPRARRSTGPRNGTALPRGAVVRGDVLRRHARRRRGLLRGPGPQDKLWPAAVVDAGALRRDPAAVLAAVVGAGAAPPGRPSGRRATSGAHARARRRLDERYAAPTAALAALLGPARRGLWSGD
ncbi:[heparan sulfate]-glucosamine N-sulfotransferase [Aureococcus anophagefferens]|nr:[heparan sulfate]-glucosamine N-sulfotransferase [Aureococcus anophagefferens]